MATLAPDGAQKKQSLEIEDPSDVSKTQSDVPKLNHGGTSSVWTASFNQTNAVVGVGILYIAEGFKESGVALFLTLFLLVGAGIYFTANLLVESGEECGIYNYYDLAAEMVGNWAYYLLCFFCMVLNFGACLGYLATIENMMPMALRDLLLRAGASDSTIESWIFSDTGFMIMLLLIIVPLSLIKNMDSLGWVSTLKVGVLAIVTIVIFQQGQTQQLKDYQNIKTWNTNDVVYFFREAKGEGKTVYKLLQATSPDGKTYIQKIKDAYTADPEGDENLHKYNAVKQILQEAETQLPASKSVEKQDIKKMRENKWNTLESIRTGGDEKIAWGAKSSWWLQLGTLMFSLVYHDSVFPIYKSMAEPTLDNWKTASGVGITIISSVHIAYGLYAYIIFKSNLPDNILTADPIAAAFPCNVMTNVIRLLFGILLVLTYPICNLLCREYTEAVLKKLTRKPTDSEYPWTTRWIITGIILILSMGIIFLGGADKANNWIDLAGGLGAGMIAFFLPGIIFFKVFGYQKIKDQTKEVLASKEAGLCDKISAVCRLYMPIVTCILGTMASLLATVIACIKIIDPSVFGPAERVPVAQ